MLSRSLMSFSRVAVAKPSMVPFSLSSSSRRSFITIIENTEDEDTIRKEIAAFANRAQFMGCDPYPHYRRVSLVVIPPFLSSFVYLL